MARSKVMLRAPAPAPASTTRALEKGRPRESVQVLRINDLGVAREIGNQLGADLAEKRGRVR